MFRIVIVDDHELFRSGVKSTLDSSKFEVVGEAADVDTAVDVILECEPDAVLLDVHLPSIYADGVEGGDEVVRRVRMRQAESLGVAVEQLRDDVKPHFLALSVSDSPEDVGAVVRAGARGYVTKTTPVESLNAALFQVASGFTVFSPKLAGFVLSIFQGDVDVNKARLEGDKDYSQLSAAEKDVLKMIAKGYSYKEVALERHVSVKTIESQVSNVLKKLRLSGRGEITYWATTRGIV